VNAPSLEPRQTPVYSYGQDAPSPQQAVAALLEVVGRDRDSTRRTDWPECDLAPILTGLLAGLRAEELRRADVGDIRTATDGGAVL
jgi:integrase/recombinase XerC